MENEPLTQDMLFLGLTRPALWLGVPIEATLTIVTIAAMLLLLTGSPLYAIAIGGSLMFASRLIVRSDYNMFRLLSLWMKTKALARNKPLWGGSSYSPLYVAGPKRKGFING